MRTLHANVPAVGWCEIRIEDGTIVGCEPVGPVRDNALYCWRGFVDLQVNGFAGVDFGTDAPDAEHFAAVLEPLFSTGVTSFYPTVVTNDPEAQIAQLQALEQARARFPLFARAVPGYHLEGPWLSPMSSHGAHDPNRMRLPDWSYFERLQAAASWRIRLVTIAPELPRAFDFIQHARSQGITVAIGHTDGTGEDVYRAIEAGASLSTHLGNGCPQALDRHKAPFWAQLADDRLKACIICDNFHVIPEVIKIHRPSKRTFQLLSGHRRHAGGNHAAGHVPDCQYDGGVAALGAGRSRRPPIDGRLRTHHGSSGRKLPKRNGLFANGGSLCGFHDPTASTRVRPEIRRNCNRTIGGPDSIRDGWKPLSRS